MLTKIIANALYSIVKKSRLEMVAEVEEIIERDGETCAQFVSEELGIEQKLASSLIRDLFNAEGIFKSEARLVGLEKAQFYTMTRPKLDAGSAIVPRAARDPLVAALFGEAQPIQSGNTGEA